MILLKALHDFGENWSYFMCEEVCYLSGLQKLIHDTNLYLDIYYASPMHIRKVM
jgi:hypothetical protein